jgi:hypothetical protein
MRQTGYGALARLPGNANQSEFLMVASNYNLSMAMVLTTASELEKIEAMRRAHGSPRHFEIVVQFERSGDRTLNSTPVAFRAIAR